MGFSKVFAAARLMGAVAGSALAIGATAAAGELALGIAYHDFSGKEEGVNLQPQLIFDAIDLSTGPAGVHPYLTASFNSEMDFNFGGAGLLYRRSFADAWQWQLQFGVVGHNGTINEPAPGIPNRQDILDTTKFYGCEALFHVSPSVGRQLAERVSLSVYYEHLSHGQIFCSGVNEGLDSGGARLSLSF